MNQAPGSSFEAEVFWPPLGTNPETLPSYQGDSAPKKYAL